MEDVSYLTLMLRALLGWIFLTSSLDKLRKREEFQGELAGYPGMRVWMITPASALIVTVELVIGAGLLLGIYWRLAAAGVVVLLAAFSIAMFFRMRTKFEGSCGCGGLVPIQSTGYSHLMFNAAMIALATVLALTPNTTGTVPNPLAINVLGKANTAFDGTAILILMLSLTGLLSISAATAIREMRKDRLALDYVVENPSHSGTED